MKKVYLLTKENEAGVVDLAKGVTTLTGGDYAVEEVKQLSTEDAKLIWVLDAMLCGERKGKPRPTEKEEGEGGVHVDGRNKLRRYPQRECSQCHDEFIPTGPSQKVCAACRDDKD